MDAIDAQIAALRAKKAALERASMRATPITSPADGVEEHGTREGMDGEKEEKKTEKKRETTKQRARGGSRTTRNAGLTTLSKHPSERTKRRTHAKRRRLGRSSARRE